MHYIYIIYALQILICIYKLNYFIITSAQFRSKDRGEKLEEKINNKLGDPEVKGCVCVSSSDIGANTQRVAARKGSLSRSLARGSERHFCATTAVSLLVIKFFVPESAAPHARGCQPGYLLRAQHM